MATEREYLITLNLAKPGRGRYSKEASDALKKAKSEGMVFDLTPGEIAKLERASKPKRIAKPAKTSPNVQVLKMNGTYDPRVVRKWAKANGHDVNARGKMPHALIQAYLSANKPNVVSSIPTQRVVSRKPVSRVAVRSETTGYTFIRRGPNDPKHISEPLVAVSNCGGCGKGVSYCGCASGPKAPKYLGGQVLLLTRPAK